MPRDAGADVFCSPGDPQTFAPLLGMGPFCGPGVHCQFGEHCCRDLELNSQTCASSCPPSTVDIACLNGAECNVGGDLDGGMICCATGTVELGVCSYAVSKDVTSTRCTTSCTDQEFEVCASSGECNGTTCTPTRALKADGQSTSAMQIAACR